MPNPKAKATRVLHLVDIPTDLPGVFWRAERRWWADGSSCLHVYKRGPRPGDGQVTGWWPPQYIQLPWECSGQLAGALTRALAAGDAAG